MKRMIACVVGLALTSILIPAALAQPQQQPAGGVEVQAKVITRVYDIADIVYGMRNYPFASSIVPPALLNKGSDFEGHGGALFSEAEMPEHRDAGAEARAAAIDQLIKLLTETITPDSWRENGGTSGVVLALGQKLVVTQTEANHERIDLFLKELRGTASTATSVTIVARWVMLDPKQVPGILIKNDKGHATNRVDADALAKVGDDLPSYRAQVTCLDGQTVNVASGNGQLTAMDLTPVISETVAAFDPEVTLLHAGIAFQVTPQVNVDGTSALVDVHSIVSDRRESGDPIELRATAQTHSSTTQPARESSGTSETQAEIDRINVISQQLQTTVRLPLDTPTLIGGMTLEPNAGAEDGRQLYLILEVSTDSQAPGAGKN